MAVGMLRPKPAEPTSNSHDSSVLDIEEEIENMRQHHRTRWKSEQQQQPEETGIKSFFRRALCKLYPGYGSNKDSDSPNPDDFFYRNPFDEIWETQKDRLKAKKIRLRWKTAVQKVKTKTPERLTSIKEIWKYYLNHCSYHGLRYWLDKKLHPFERIFWVLAFLIGFGWAIKIILQIYSEFQSRKSNIIIDEVNKEIEEVPFPSITVCPPTRVDWVKALEMADELIPKDNEKAREHFLKLLDSACDIRLSNLNELQLNTDDSTVLQILNEINMTDVMLNVLPECETFIFNCSWKFENQSCCDIFELQRSSFGFCYSFNSLTSEKSEGKIPQVVYTYGMRSGLRFSTLMINQSHYPPSMKELDYQLPMPIMFSDVRAVPLKSRYFAFGRRYYVSVKFTCCNASPDILALENERNPPCKHENGLYKYENCFMHCMLMYVEENCACLPSFFFKPPASQEFRSCNVSDMRCLAAAVTDFQLHKEKSKCQCVNECEYIDYDDFIGTIPSYSEDRIVVDIHFDGPTGVCYKREIVFNALDMLVQFGGIFGLLVGGSLISFAELLYGIVLTIILIICCKFNYFKKKDINKTRLVIEVHSRNDSALQISRQNNNDIYRHNHFP